MFGSRILLIVTVVALGGWLAVYGSFERGYVGETDILVLSRNEQAERGIERVISDAEKLPGSLAFYDILLRKNADIEDRFAGLSDAERKAGWNEELSVERKGESGILIVKVTHPSEAQAQLLSQKTAEDIVIVMNRYYSATAGLDIRVIDGTVVGRTGRVFGFDTATAVGTLLAAVGVLLIVASGTKRRPVMKIKRAFRKQAAEEIAVPGVIPDFEDPREIAETDESDRKPETIIASEEEIRNRLNKLLEGKI
jgi:hypothetical protein